MAIRIEDLDDEHRQGRGCPTCLAGSAPPRQLVLVHGRRADGRPRRYATRRAVVLLAVLLVTAALAVAAAAARAPGASAESSSGQPAPWAADWVVLAPGETLWEVLAPHTPAGVDRRAFVAQVLEENDVDGRAIPPGQTIRLPAP